MALCVLESLKVTTEKNSRLRHNKEALLLHTISSYFVEYLPGPSDAWQRAQLKQPSLCHTYNIWFISYFRRCVYSARGAMHFGKIDALAATSTEVFASEQLRRMVQYRQINTFRRDVDEVIGAGETLL